MFKIKIYCTIFAICGVYRYRFFQYLIIHSLYNKSVTLLKSLMKKFVDFNMLTQKENWLNINSKQSKDVKT